MSRRNPRREGTHGDRVIVIKDFTAMGICAKESLVPNHIQGNTLAGYLEIVITIQPGVSIISPHLLVRQQLRNTQVKGYLQKV